jgi:hypothetical protein
MRIKTNIKLPIYDCNIIFIITDDLKSEVKTIYKKYEIVSIEDEGESAGMLLSPDIDIYILLIDPHYLSHNTIAHEIYHAAVRITKDRDISDEETQAWLCGHITERVYKFLVNKKIQIKYGR